MRELGRRSLAPANRFGVLAFSWRPLRTSVKKEKRLGVGVVWATHGPAGHATAGALESPQGFPTCRTGTTRGFGGCLQVVRVEMPMRMVRSDWRRDVPAASESLALGGQLFTSRTVMASSMARDGRRRRVLNDEVRAAAGIALSAGATAADPDAPRYGEQAGVEHHPQVTDFVPRRKRALLLMLAATLGAAAAAQALVQFGPQVAGALPGMTAETSAQLAGGMTAWTSAMALLACAGLARVIYSLRRHRVDDYRGRYRAWRWVGWTAMAASFTAVAGLHGAVAEMARAATGWSLTAGGAEWWLAPVALVGGWVFVRMTLDMAESRTALAPTLVGAACYGLAAAGAFGWSPAILGDAGGVLVNSLPLAGHALVLAGLMTFGRYVVLDVQGLIDHAPRRAAKPKKEKKAKADAAAETSPAAAKTPAATLPMRSAPAAAQEIEWTDGEDDQDEEDAPSRRLSKIDRKRLRKQNRAA